MDNLVLDTTVSGNQYELQITENGKYVVETTGSVTLGIWGPFPRDKELGPTPPFGKLRVSGTNAWGCRQLTVGRYYVQCTGESYTLKIRHWKFSDYIMINMHKGTT